MRSVGVRVTELFDGDLVAGEEVELEVHCSVTPGTYGSRESPPEGPEVEIQSYHLLANGKPTGKEVQLSDELFDKHFPSIEEKALLAFDEYDDYPEHDDYYDYDPRDED